MKSAELFRNMPGGAMRSSQERSRQVPNQRAGRRRGVRHMTTSMRRVNEQRVWNCHESRSQRGSAC